MKKLILTLFSLVLLQAGLQAQSTLGLHLDSFFPTGELKKDSPELWGGGFNLEVAVQLNNSPIHVGGQLGFLRYGSELRDGWHGPDLGDVRVRRNNDIFNTLGFVRLKPEVKGMVQPYADFLGGFSYIYTRANFRDSAFDDPFDSVTDLDDFSFNYGMGGGVEFFLNDYLSFDIRARVLKGSRAEYLTSRSVRYNTAEDGYDLTVKNARFEYLTFGFGIKVLLASLD